MLSWFRRGIGKEAFLEEDLEGKGNWLDKRGEALLKRASYIRHEDGREMDGVGADYKAA